MSLRALPLLILLACSTVLSGQAPAPPRAEATAAQPSTPLPVRRVVLYKTGVGYFEHLGNVRNRRT